MDINIRPARASEMGEVTRIRLAAYDPFFAPLAAAHDAWRPFQSQVSDLGRYDQDGVTLVAVDPSGRVLGTVLYLTHAPDNPGWDDSYAFIRRMAVDPAAQGLGIGRLLLNASIEYARRERRNLALQTLSLMDTAIHLYESAGFVRNTAGDYIDSNVPIFCFNLTLLNTQAAKQVA